MPDHIAIANQYIADVLSGKVPACKWVKLACKRQADDLKRKRFAYRFDRERAARACRFIEAMPHSKGRWAAKGELIKLEPFQAFIETTIFGWVDKKTGARRFREAYVEVPRKNGKSIWAAANGLMMFVADGEYGAEVYSGATTEKQAWEIFRPARMMAKKSPDFVEHFGITVSASNLCIIENGSRFEPLIGSPGDGSSPSCALIDEYHEHSGPELYDTMITGMGARTQPLALIITTAGSNLSGPCYEKHGYVKKLLDGVIEDDRMFGIIYTIDDDDDWTTEEALKKANPNFNVSVSAEYLQMRQQTAMQSASQQNAFKTKHLNVWCGAKTAWMNMQRWARCPARLPLDELVGRPCFMAVDLATKIDIAAAGLLFPPHGDDKRYHYHGRYYLPEDVVEERAHSNNSHYDSWAKQGLLTLTPGNVIDFDYIMDDIRDVLANHNVIEVAYDPWQATQMAAQLVAEGAPMVEMRATVQNFSEPMKSLEALVMSGRFAHGGCPVLTWMVSNVVAKLDAKDNIYPNKERPENKIDGAVAAIMALGRSLAARDIAIQPEIIIL